MKRESVGRKKQFRFGRLVQPWTVHVLALNLPAQSQDLLRGDTSPSDQKGRTARSNRSQMFCKIAAIALCNRL